MSQAGWADIISNGPGPQDGPQGKRLHINPKRPAKFGLDIRYNAATCAKKSSPRCSKL